MPTPEGKRREVGFECANAVGRRGRLIDRDQRLVDRNPSTGSHGHGQLREFVHVLRRSGAGANRNRVVVIVARAWLHVMEVRSPHDAASNSII